MGRQDRSYEQGRATLPLDPCPNAFTREELKEGDEGQFDLSEAAQKEVEALLRQANYANTQYAFNGISTDAPAFNYAAADPELAPGPSWSAVGSNHPNINVPDSRPIVEGSANQINVAEDTCPFFCIKAPGHPTEPVYVVTTPTSEELVPKEIEGRETHTWKLMSELTEVPVPLPGHVPSGRIWALGSDHAMAIWDICNDTLYEFHGAHRFEDPTNSHYGALAINDGVRIEHAHEWDGVCPTGEGRYGQELAEAGVSYALGMIFMQDIVELLRGWKLAEEYYEAHQSEEPSLTVPEAWETLGYPGQSRHMIGFSVRVKTKGFEAPAINTGEAIENEQSTDVAITGRGTITEGSDEIKMTSGINIPVAQLMAVIYEGNGVTSGSFFPAGTTVKEVRQTEQESVVVATENAIGEGGKSHTAQTIEFLSPNPAQGTIDEVTLGLVVGIESTEPGESGVHIAELGLSDPLQLWLARALQTHGWYLHDATGGPVTFQMEDPVTLGSTTPNGADSYSWAAVNPLANSRQNGDAAVEVTKYEETNFQNCTPSSWAHAAAARTQSGNPCWWDRCPWRPGQRTQRDLRTLDEGGSASEEEEGPCRVRARCCAMSNAFPRRGSDQQRT